MKLRFSISLIKNIQKSLLCLVAVTSFMGGVGLIATNGLGMEPEILDPTPFNSFVIPGIILAGIVGGTHAVAFISLQKNKRDAQFLCAVAGFGLLIWLFVETYWLPHSSSLQLIYFAIGVLELMAVLGILNIAPWLIKKNPS